MESSPMFSIILYTISITRINDEEYNRLIQENEMILVKFSIPNCHYCVELEPMFESLEMYVDIPVVEVECVRNALCGKLGLYEYPTVMLLGKDFKSDRYAQNYYFYGLADYIDKNTRWFNKCNGTYFKVNSNKKLNFEKIANESEFNLCYEKSDNESIDYYVENELIKTQNINNETDIELFIDFNRFSNITFNSKTLRLMEKSPRESVVVCGASPEYDKKFEEKFLIVEGCTAWETFSQHRKHGYEQSVTFYSQETHEGKYAIYDLGKQNLDEILSKFDSKIMTSAEKMFKEEL